MKILCVHPNFELYGSDRSFAMAVDALIRARPEMDVTVLLPQAGPMLSLQPFDRVKPVFRNMWILRRRGLLRSFTVGLPRNIVALYRALKDLNLADLTYINTIIPFDFLLMSRFTRRAVIIHVREIPNGIELRFFRWLLIWSKAKLVFNSRATLEVFKLPPTVETGIVYNGFADPGPAHPPHWTGDRPLNVLMVGRINHWKGQEILVDAIGLLSTVERQAVRVRIVGGTFNNQIDFEFGLTSHIKRLNLDQIIQLDPFENDPANSFRHADIVVVPSRLPEPFGRVAIEAMAYARAVVCSAHGGLTEIVVDKVTGRHFAPAIAADLARVLREMLNDPASVEKLGAAGRHRYLDMFTSDASDAAFVAMISQAKVKAA